MHERISLLVIGLAATYILSGCLGVITYPNSLVSRMAVMLKSLRLAAARLVETRPDPR